jgi:plasmid rolling circle replication initiator protein Rep
MMKNLAPESKIVKDTQELESLEARKRDALRVSYLFKTFNKKKAAYLQSCARTVTFVRNQDDNSLTFLSAQFCRQRLCPVCAWWRSRRTFTNVMRVLAEPEIENLRFIFITLSVRNVPGGDLGKTVDNMYRAWHLLAGDKPRPFRRSFAGTFRALEITYNAKVQSYHPHFHILAAVSPAYFKKTNTSYLSTRDIVVLWRRALGVDYDPVCDVRRVKGESWKPVAEVAKYTVKSAEIREAPVLETLDRVLRGRRLTAYGGLLKEVARRIKIADEADYDDKDQADVWGDPAIIKVIYTWSPGVGGYVLKGTVGGPAGGGLGDSDPPGWGGPGGGLPPGL